MFGNYLKVAWRNILKHKGYSLLNIAGLGLGIAACLLIALWIRDELGFDRFHPDVDRLHQILIRTDDAHVATTTPVLLAEALQAVVPEIAEASRFDNMGSVLLSRGSESFYERRLWAADPSFFGMFSFPFIEGDPASALRNPGSIVISDLVANKVFANESALGKTLTLNRRHDFTVSGVIRIPRNSTLDPQIVVPMAFDLSIQDPSYLHKGNFFPMTFVKLRGRVPPETVEGKINDAYEEFCASPAKHVLSLLPLAQRHFRFFADRTALYAMAVIALCILALACFNYVNLTTARSANRAKEIGVRKVSGAGRKQIIAQYWAESLVLSAAALWLAALLVAVLLPVLNAISGRSLAFDLSLLGWIIPAMVALAVLTGFAGGAYPAVFLSSIQPVKALSGRLRRGAAGATLRKSLVLVQFAITIILMAGTGVVYKQLEYVRNKDLGYDKDLLVQIRWRLGAEAYRDVLKRELRRDPRVLGVTGTQAAFPFVGWRNSSIDWDGRAPDQTHALNYNVIDFDFVETMRIKMAEGRSSSGEFSSDAKTGFLVNEKMAEFMGGGSVVGKRIAAEGVQGQVLGVIKDFHFRTLAERIAPLVLRVDPDRVTNTLIRIQSGRVPDSLRFIKETWERTVPNFPFDFTFLNDNLEMGYADVERTGRLVKSFAVLAALISCLGLFGLSSYLSEQRTKEIGIRRVLGAPVSGVVWLLSKEFVRNVLAANLLAWPTAYIIMNRWISGFAYRTAIGPEVFLLSGGIALTIAILTTAFQSVRAAAANPVDSIKYE